MDIAAIDADDLDGFVEPTRAQWLERRCNGIIMEFQEISRKERSGENWILFTRTLMRVRGELSSIEREH